MENQDLVALIETEVSNSIGGGTAGAGSSGLSVNAATKQLSTERAMELDYYNSAPFGNEREGESQVVSSDVFDAVEGMLPHLLKTFTASDDAVEFEPNGIEDEEAAKQRTDACNYVFYRQNNGFILMYEWFKDALLQKNGIVKYWWEEKTDVSEDEYQGMTEGEYLTIKQDPDVEILSEKSYDDPDAAEQKQKTLAQYQNNPQVAQNPQSQMILQQMMQVPVSKLYDCKIKTTKDVSKICIAAIPPEEFGISSKHNCISIQDAPFCYHETKMTISALREMGCPESVIEDIGNEDDNLDSRPESLARNRFIDEGSKSGDDTADPSLREVAVKDCFIRLDWDGDGKAELRHVIIASRTTWINEPASHINFAAITPIIMPHRWIGKSIAEITMDFQFLNSVLLRQVLNNLYLTNNPQKVVLGTAGGQVMADLDRLMTSRVGGILVEYAPNAIRNQEVPFAAAATMPIIEYFEGKKEQRTGNTRYNQGTDADSLNKTARGISMIQSASQQKLDLIARIFAETGVKDLFRGIAYFLSKYSTKKMTLRLRNKWVDVDPREWKTQFDMTVNVGLGTGNKDAQLVHLAKMHEMQIELMKEGKGYLVTDENVFNLAKKMAENMGFKTPELFISEPASQSKPDGVKPPPPQPNPEMVKIQQADAEVKQKIQSNEKIRLFDAKTNKEIETIKGQFAFQIAQMQEETKRLLEGERLKHEAQNMIFKTHGDNAGQMKMEFDARIKDAELSFEKWKIEYVESNKVLLAEIAAKNGLDQTALKAERGSEQIIVDTTGAVAKGLTDSIAPIAKNIDAHGKILASHTNALQGMMADRGNQDKLAMSVALLADAQAKNSDAAKAPRKHTIKKTGDGYEITTQ